MLKVKVPGGRLVARQMPDEENPGIIIEFEPEEERYSNLSVLVEHNAENGLQTVIWADENKEDYTHKIKFER